MKNLILKTKFVAMSLLIVLFCSCNPEDGEMGPPGTNGINGVDGANGQDGQDGNANVMASAWIEYDAANWSALSSEFGVDYRNYPVTVSEIDAAVVDSGVVLVFTRFSGNVYSLAFTENITGASAEGQILSHRFSLGSLIIKMRNVSGSGDPSIFGGSSYRYVILPSNNTTKSSGIDFTKLSYEEVVDYFGLNH